MNRIKDLRTEFGYSMETLASKCNIVKSNISQYESGKRTPSNATQEALADIFNVDIDYLMGRTNVRRRIDLEGSIHEGINSNEIEIIKAYRKADESSKKAINVLLGVDNDQKRQ